MNALTALPGYVVAGVPPPLPPEGGFVICSDLDAQTYVGSTIGRFGLADATVFRSPTKARYAADLYAARDAVNYVVIPRRDALRLERHAG
ncbi:MAG: hypothetical protein ABI790_02460 [Betaproteobacteria bacterium]